jgi:hypothetical protein
MFGQCETPFLASSVGEPYEESGKSVITKYQFIIIKGNVEKIKNEE